jgi:hypothetical protein
VGRVELQGHPVDSPMLLSLWWIPLSSICDFVGIAEGLLYGKLSGLASIVYNVCHLYLMAYSDVLMVSAICHVKEFSSAISHVKEFSV